MRRSAGAVAVSLLLAFCALRLGAGVGAVAAVKTNRLAKSTSPYLRAAARQAIDWYEWSPEAFARARQENKPILLDVGAAWCHWCHVMDEKTYEHAEVVKLLNESFVCIKVDRDERPDVDRRYQEACGVLGATGWPLTAFLTPAGKVFAAGTYFPPLDEEQRAGLKSVLERIARAWKGQQDKVLESAELIAKSLRETEAARVPYNSAVVERIWAEVTRAYDEKHGGFGRGEGVTDAGVPRGAKFPLGAAIEFALVRHFEDRDSATLQMSKRTLNAMSDGGLHDQLGGGYHRYSVDGAWHIPHFEKMLYVQAEMLRCLAIAYQLSNAERYKRLSESLVGYVNRELRDSDGNGFFASQDADNARGDDGGFYAWTQEEMAKTLTPEEHNVCLRYFGLDDRRHRLEGTERFVPQRALSGDMLAERLKLSEEQIVKHLESGTRKLIEARGKRPSPAVDRTIYVNWNAQMISSMLVAYRAFGNREWRDQALRITDRLLVTAYRKGRGMFHRVAEGQATISGLLDDQVQMARALLDAYEVSADPRYVEAARDLLEFVHARMLAPEGGYFDRVHVEGDLGFLTVPQKPIDDAPTPSANAIAALAMLRLSRATSEPKYAQWAEAALKALCGRAQDYGRFASTFALVAREQLSPGPTVIVIGKRDDPRTQALWAIAQRTYRPGSFVVLRDPTEPNLPVPAGKDGPVAYVALGNLNSGALRDSASLAPSIQNFGRRR